MLTQVSAPPQYSFSVKEIGEERTKFTAPANLNQNPDWRYQLVEQAAYIYFMGAGGWKCEHGWPLTFIIYAPSGAKTLEGIVFVLDGETPPKLDVIFLERP
jgi:hypothetical protein